MFARRFLSKAMPTVGHNIGRVGGRVLGAGLQQGADPALQSKRKANVDSHRQKAVDLGGYQGFLAAARGGVNDQMMRDGRALQGHTRKAVMTNPSVFGEQRGALEHFANHPISRGVDGTLEIRNQAGNFQPLHELGHNDMGHSAANRMLGGNFMMELFGEKP